jgi:hypothetical protein
MQHLMCHANTQDCCPIDAPDVAHVTLLLQAFIVSNLVAPTWPITLANIMLIIQVLGCYQVRI